MSKKGASHLKLSANAIKSKNLRKAKNQPNQAPKIFPQHYDYFLVLDFEATCQDGSTIQKQEIIEFPVLKVDAKTFDVVDKFHEYVRPVHNPELTSFCTQLTGITQEMVDGSDTFPIVFGNFQQWMIDQVGLDNRFLFVTCGDWDLKVMLPGQCKMEKIVLPDYFTSWMNIKKAFCHVTGIFHKGIIPMLQQLNIEHVGRLHSGIDDCHNIVAILAALARTGCAFRPTVGENRHRVPPLPERSAEPPEGDMPTREQSLPHGAVGAESLYPTLSGSYEDLARSPLYEPYEEADDDRRARRHPSADQSLRRDSSGDQGLRRDSSGDQGLQRDSSGDQGPLCAGAMEQDPICKRESPDYTAIIARLKENLCSKRFRSRDREELVPLCAAGKYLQLMEEEDRMVVGARLRFFYVGLCYGWRVAERDAHHLTASAVGIEIAPEVMSRRRYKEKEKSLRRKERKGVGDFELL